MIFNFIKIPTFYKVVRWLLKKKRAEYSAHHKKENFAKKHKVEKLAQINTVIFVFESLLCLRAPIFKFFSYMETYRVYIWQL